MCRSNSDSGQETEGNHIALTIGQIASSAYPAILANKRMPHNQWAESGFLHTMEKMGFVQKEDFGATIDAPLDYQRNPGTVIQTTDLQPLALTKTEVITSASYAIAEVTAPVTWSKKDEVQTPQRNQKIQFTKSLMENAIESHDDILEQQIFSTSTNGFLGLQNIIPYTNTSPSLGGIDPSANTFWRNQTNTYTDDTDLESALTTTWNQCAKASGATLLPKLLVSDGITNALFEGTQQAMQRYDSQELKAGFKTIMFKTANWIFSQYGNGRVYFLNPKNFKLAVSKAYFREFDETMSITNANGFTRRIYSAVQALTNNRSRLGICSTAALA